MAKKETVLPQDQKELPTTSYLYQDKKKRVSRQKRPENPVLNVSQSMIKDVRKYLKKEMCGLVLKAKYITKTYPYDADDSPAKRIGRYFEYILFGGLPKSGKIPQPEYMVSVINAKKKLVENKGKTDAEIIAMLSVEDMYEPYRLAHANASRVRYYFEKMGITVLSVGVTISKDGMEGTIDIRALYKGQEIVIDVKYSGLIDDQWNELGWRWTRDQRKFHGTQATHYHILTDVPFYFLVVSSTNLIDILFNEIVFDDHSIQSHLTDVEDTRQKMETYNEVGFNAYPDIKRCSSCALRDICESRQDVPEVKLVWLNEDLI